MTQIICVSDIVEKNGKTIRENNLALRHNIPIGTLVEVKFDSWFGGGACWKVHARLWVVSHTRDCDGTPLYSIGRYKKINVDRHHGFSEESLTVVDVTPDVADGIGALEWNE